MRKVSCTHIRSAAIAALGIFGFAISAYADSYDSNAQFGFNLPPVTMPYGQDQVRAMDGTFCQSSVSNGGAYLDMGVIGNGGYEDVPGSGAVYGRLVVPLGTKPKRLDCTTLYDLEIERLRMELQLTRMGISNSTTPAPNADWQSQGWTAKGRNTALRH